MYKLPKESEIVKLSPRVVRMGWQTKENSVDRGIFVMRVMETYMGTLLGWTTGLRTENVCLVYLYKLVWLVAGVV